MNETLQRQRYEDSDIRRRLKTSMSLQMVVGQVSAFSCQLNPIRHFIMTNTNQGIYRSGHFVRNMRVSKKSQIDVLVGPNVFVCIVRCLINLPLTFCRFDVVNWDHSVSSPSS